VVRRRGDAYRVNSFPNNKAAVAPEVPVPLPSTPVTDLMGRQEFQLSVRQSGRSLYGLSGFGLADRRDLFPYHGLDEAAVFAGVGVMHFELTKRIDRSVDPAAIPDRRRRPLPLSPRIGY